MTTLIVSQIIFNLVASVAIIAIGVLVGTIAFDVIKFLKSVKIIFNNINDKSNQLYNNLDKFFANISVLPFISRLFKKKKSK